MVKRKITIAIDESLLNAIDRTRGIISRSTYIELMIRAAVRSPKPETKNQGHT